jgi:UDPglucose 6-dehydrogenase
MSKVTVIGTGYVGATTAILLSSLEHEVIAYDIKPTTIKLLSDGHLPIYEPGLETYLLSGINSGKLRFTSNLLEAINGTEFVFICVPTPESLDGSADLTFVLEVARNISKILPSGAVVITKSTVPVGASEEVFRTLNRQDVHYASNPEFLREGSAVHDFLHPDRVVVGAKDRSIAEKVAGLYGKLRALTLITDPASAELIKYASNSFLAIKISYVNEIARLCDPLRANVIDVMRGFGMDSRIGEKFTSAGPGWGGSCFPKDTKALSALGKLNNVNLQMIDAALESNQMTKKLVSSKLQAYFKGDLAGKKVAIWGLAFKAFTDDTRESPAIEIAERLIHLGAKVSCYDPQVTAIRNPMLSMADSIDDSVVGADAVLVLTEWPEFSAVDPTRVLSMMKGSVVFDTRTVLDRERWTKSGATFIPYGIPGTN